MVREIKLSCVCAGGAIKAEGGCRLVLPDVRTWDLPLPARTPDRTHRATAAGNSTPAPLGQPLPPCDPAWAWHFGRPAPAVPLNPILLLCARTRLHCGSRHAPRPPRAQRVPWRWLRGSTLGSGMHRCMCPHYKAGTQCTRQSQGGGGVFRQGEISFFRFVPKPPTQKIFAQLGPFLAPWASS